MTEAEEGLAADLRLTGSTAWARLHGEITSRLTATVRRPDGGDETLPMSVVRGLAHDPDPARRRAAYDAELAAWDTVTVPLAAALNGAKGETIVLNRRRGWADALEPALFTNGVDRATLDAMHEAVDRLAARLPPLPAGQGPRARPPTAPAAVVGPVRPGRATAAASPGVAGPRP